jgi:hypothetical protein
MKPAAALLLVLAAAACNGQTGGGNQPAAQTATGTPPEAAVATPLQPGRWEMTMRAVSVELPNASPEIAAQVRAQPLPPVQVQYDCVTQQEAARPMEGFRQQLIHDQPNLSCTPGEQQFDDGRIRIVMECRGLNSQPDQRMALVGTFTTNTLQAAVSTTTTTPVAGSPQLVQVENTMTGRWVGACDGTETE